METQDDLDLGTAPDDLQQGQSDATLLKQVCCPFLVLLKPAMPRIA